MNRRAILLSLCGAMGFLLAQAPPLHASCAAKAAFCTPASDCPPSDDQCPFCPDCPDPGDKCPSATCPTAIGQQVVLGLGNEVYAMQDLVLNGMFPIEMSRLYNSASLYDSPLGYGWSLNYNYRLYKYPKSTTFGVVVIRAHCGQRRRYFYTGVDSQGNSQWAEAAGPHRGTLVGSPDGSYTLTQQTGKRFVFDSYGRLTTLAAASGPSLRLSYTNSKMPLMGVSPYGFSQDQLMVVAYDYQLQEVDEYDASGNPTGHFIKFTYDNSLTGRLTQITDSMGRTVQYMHDGLGNLTQMVDAAGNTFTYEYKDTHGLRGIHRMTAFSPGSCSECSPSHRVVLAYDDFGRVISETDQGGKSTYSYTSANPTVARPPWGSTQVVKNNGAVWNYTWNGLDRPSQVTDPYGNVVTTLWDQTLTYPTSEASYQLGDGKGGGGGLALKKAVTKTWDNQGNLLSEDTFLPAAYAGGPTDAIHREMTYDHGSVLTQKTWSRNDPALVEQNRFTYFYNAYGYPSNIQTESRWDGAEWLTTSYQYDGNGQLQQITRPNGDTETYAYQGGCLAQANGIAYTNDSACRRTALIDRNRNQTAFSYDALDRVLTVTDPLGDETLNTYFGRVVTQVEVGRLTALPGHLTQYFRDAYDRVLEMDRSYGTGHIAVVRYAYDSDGNVTSSTDADGNTTSYSYDSLDRLIQTKDAEGHRTTYTYDSLGNRTSATDGNGHATAWFYDGLGRLEEVVDANGGKTLYTYDPFGNLLTVTDANGHTTTYAYDLLNRLVSETRPLGEETLYGYDYKGRLVQRTDAKGQVTKYGYRSVDDALTSIKYYSSAYSLLAGRTITYSLDGNGNQLGVDDSGAYALTGNDPLYMNTFDALNRMTSQEANHVGKILFYAYDRFGNRSEMTLRDLASSQPLLDLAYAYDDMDRVAGMVQSPAPSTVANGYAFTYYPSGRLESKVFPNRVAGEYTYFKDGTVQSISYTDTKGTQLLGLAYTQDAAHNYLSQVRTEPSQTITRNFSYDNLNELTGVVRNGSSFESFAYDPVGNRTAAGGPSPGNLVGNYVTDPDNRLLSVGNGATTFAWDANGNQTSQIDGQGTRNYGYEFENRLATFNFGATAASYVYDPTARRLSKVVNGQETRFLWDGSVMIAEATSSGTVTRLYVMNPQTNEPIGIIDIPATGSTLSYAVLTDHLQTSLILSDAAQAVSWRSELRADLKTSAA